MAHPLAGRPQSAEHIAKRAATTAATKARWSAERHAAFRRRVSDNNAAGRPEVRRKNSAAHRGQSPWNKGNNWRANCTVTEIRVRAARRQERHRQKVHNRIGDAVSASMRRALKVRKGGQRWESLVGYTVHQLMEHLGGRFQPGMSWTNYGTWHIDHVRPRASFIYTSATDQSFRECWALSNLQPLWALDNLKKGARRMLAAA